MMFERSEIIGSSAFLLASECIAQILNEEPLQYRGMEAAGVPAAFIDATLRKIPVHSDVIADLPNAYRALSLNEAGRELILQRKALRCMVPVFTSKEYIHLLGSSGSSMVGSGLEELIRHTNLLRGHVIDVVLEILDELRKLGSDGDAATGDIAAMETEQDAAAGRRESGSVPRDSSDDEGYTLVKCISYTSSMLNHLLRSNETTRLFLDQGGHTALLPLFTLSRLPSSFGASNACHSLSTLFKLMISSCFDKLDLIYSGIFRAMHQPLEDTIDMLESLGPDANIPQILQDMDDKKNDKKEAGSSHHVDCTPLASRYIKTVSTIDALILVAAYAIRNSTPSIMIAARGGDDSIIAKVGRVQDLVYRNAAVAEEWQVREHAKTLVKENKKRDDADGKEENATGRGDSPGGGGGQPMAVDIVAPIGLDDASASMTVTIADGCTEEKEKEKQVDKSSAQISYDIMQHAISACRGFFNSVNKCIHAPYRPSHDYNSQDRPCIEMDAAAVSLASMLHCSLLATSPEGRAAVVKAIAKEKEAKVEAASMPESKIRMNRYNRLVSKWKNVRHAPSDSKGKEPVDDPGTAPTLSNTDEVGASPSYKEFDPDSPEIYCSETARWCRHVSSSFTILGTMLLDTRRMNVNTLVFNYFITSYGLDTFLRHGLHALDILRRLPALQEGDTKKQLIKAIYQRNKLVSTSDDGKSSSSSLGTPPSLSTLPENIVNNPSLLFRIELSQTIISFFKIIAITSQVGGLISSNTLLNYLNVTMPLQSYVGYQPSARVSNEHLVRTLSDQVLSVTLPVWRDVGLLQQHPWLLNMLAPIISNCCDQHSSGSANVISSEFPYIGGHRMRASRSRVGCCYSIVVEIYLLCYHSVVIPIDFR